MNRVKRKLWSVNCKLTLCSCKDRVKEYCEGQRADYSGGFTGQRYYVAFLVFCCVLAYCTVLMCKYMLFFFLVSQT